MRKLRRSKSEQRGFQGDQEGACRTRSTELEYAAPGAIATNDLNNIAILKYGRAYGASTQKSKMEHFANAKTAARAESRGEVSSEMHVGESRRLDNLSVAIPHAERDRIQLMHATLNWSLNIPVVKAQG